MKSLDDMHAYYKERAPVYDRVYSYPERQSDLRFLEDLVTNTFTDCDVLEVAAGTGYWTQFISRRAKSVLATDISEEPLVQIAARNTHGEIQTRLCDAYSLEGIDDQFNGAFAGLWFSHIPIERRTEWLTKLHQCLAPGSTVLLLDNSIAQCQRLPISHTDGAGNTYQNRETDSGNTFQILKNFPDEEELLDLTGSLGNNQKFQALEHFWVFEYETST